MCTLFAESLLERCEYRGEIPPSFSCTIVLFWAMGTLPAESLLERCEYRGELSHCLFLHNLFHSRGTLPVESLLKKNVNTGGNARDFVLFTDTILGVILVAFWVPWGPLGPPLGSFLGRFWDPFGTPCWDTHSSEIGCVFGSLCGALFESLGAAFGCRPASCC